MGKSRQLAAIMFTDIKGYSEMMEDNEEFAALLREKMTHSVKTHVVDHHGRVVKFEGDGSLCVFNSAINAVQAAIAIQHDMRKEPRVPLRIGLHSGDIVLDETEIYGDGVNVASRVESFAIEGGILLSGKVRDDIKNQQHISTISLGNYQFKNIKAPVELFAVSNPGIAVPQKNKLQGKGVSLRHKGFLSPIQKRIAIGGIALLAIAVFIFFQFFNPAHNRLMKSVAVMPFQNLNPDAESDFFADGITLDILTQISKIQDLNVIAPSSMAVFKNSNMSLQQIGKELNAGAILEGSIRREDDKIRIFAQLVEANSGQNLWAEVYDREYASVFDIQSEIAQIIATVLKAKLSPAEKARIKRKPTDNLTAYEYYLKGRDHYFHYTKDENELAIENFKKAIELDKNYALAWAGLGDAYSQKFGRFGFSGNWVDSSREAGLKAIELDSTSSEAFKALANAYNYLNQYDSGFLLVQKAVMLNPNNAAAVGNLGTGYFLRGQLDEALRWQKKSAALDPKKFVPFQITGWIYRLLGDYENSVAWLQKSLDLNPHPDTYRELAYTYIFMGQPAEAVKLIPKLVAVDSANHQVYEIAGNIAHLTGREKEALQYFRRSVELNENLATDIYTFAPISLGQLLMKEGKEVDAEIYLSRSLFLNLEEINNQKNQDDDPRLYVAAIFAIRGNKEEALNWLKQAEKSNWVDYVMVEKHPWFQNLQNDPQFQQIISLIKNKVVKMNYRTSAL